MPTKREPSFVVSEFFSDAMNTLIGPAHLWRRIVRRVYVVTWPVSLLVRCALVVGTVAMVLVTGFVEFMIERLRCIWEGNRSMWD